jgi:sulfur transfer complex TusBCD TusB component (DsrH family)
MDTLGSLIDKLTIVKLKQYHTEDIKKLESLKTQEGNLIVEINAFVFAAVDGKIPRKLLSSPSNKVYNIEEDIEVIQGSNGWLVSELAMVNCELWHEQETVYQFELVAPELKDGVIQRLAKLNILRTKYIDLIDEQFQRMIKQ